MNNLIMRCSGLCIIFLYGNQYCATEGSKQIAALEYLSQNVTTAKSTIFEDQFILNMIGSRLNDIKAWLTQELRTNSDKTLEKALARIEEAVGHIYNKINLFSRNMDSIKGNAEVRKNFRKDVRDISQFRDALKKEHESSSSLQKLKKQKFPPISKAKKEIADVLLAYADSFIKIAQRAITDFARIDGALFIREQNATKKATPSSRKSESADDWSDWDYQAPM